MKLRKQTPLKLAALGVTAVLFAVFYAVVQAERIASQEAATPRRIDYESFFAPRPAPQHIVTPEVQPRPHTRTRAS